VVIERVQLAQSLVDGTEAVMLLSSQTPDLVLLDLMLPGLSGEEVLPKIKGIPVIIVSAKVGVEDKVSLLLRGAADYSTKPFDMKELLARISVQLRKAEYGGIGEKIVFDDILLDTDSHIASVSEKEIRLTRTEYAILKLLMRNPNQVIAKSNLRRKLREINNKDYIESVWGIGFKMRSEN